MRTWSTRRRSATTVPPLDQAPGDQSVDHRGDAGRPHGQTLGQVGGDGRALVQQAEHPVLGQGEVGRAQPDLDLLGQPGRGAAQGQLLVGRGCHGPVRARARPSCFEGHIVRLSNEIGRFVHLRARGPPRSAGPGESRPAGLSDRVDADRRRPA